MKLGLDSALIVGHRGNPGNPLNTRRIENTSDSFDSAWDIGVDGVELDAHLLLKDGILVVYHDDNLGRVFEIPRDDCSRLVSEYSWEELQRAELSRQKLEDELRTKHGKKVDLHKYTSLKIPKLEELLPLPPGKKLFLELKFPNDVEPKDKEYLNRLVKAIVEFIEKNKIIDQTYVLSFVPSALREIKRLNSRIKTAYNVYQHETDQPDSKKIIRELKREYGFDAINPPFEQLPSGSIATIHELNLRTFPWVWKQTDREELDETKRLLENGADGTINNQPQEAITIRNGIVVS